MSHKHSGIRPDIRTREALPIAKQMKSGSQLLCPFCTPTHPLALGESSACGTTIKVTAVQIIIPSRIARINHTVCIKCHREGHGDMVRYGNAYVHLENCDPKTRLLSAMPNNNVFAKIVFKLPKGLRRQIEKTTGTAQQVREVDDKGVETGRVIAHFFMPTVVRQAVRKIEPIPQEAANG
jgi:hypothetical protein